MKSVIRAGGTGNTHEGLEGLLLSHFYKPPRHASVLLSSPAAKPGGN